MKLEPNSEKFDAAAGLIYAANDEELYIEIIQVFLREFEQNSQDLAAYLNSDDMKKYEILIHSMKNNLRTLGASAAGEAAYEQELHCKSGDFDHVKMHHDSFLKELKLAELYLRQYLLEYMMQHSPDSM